MRYCYIHILNTNAHDIGVTLMLIIASLILLTLAPVLFQTQGERLARILFENNPSYKDEKD